MTETVIQPDTAEPPVVTVPPPNPPNPPTQTMTISGLDFSKMGLTHPAQDEVCGAQQMPGDNTIQLNQQRVTYFPQPPQQRSAEQDQPKEEPGAFAKLTKLQVGMLGPLVLSTNWEKLPPDSIAALLTIVGEIAMIVNNNTPPTQSWQTICSTAAKQF